MSFDIFDHDEEVKRFHDDTVSLYAYKDKKLMMQATDLQNSLNEISENSKSTRLSIAIVNLQRKLRSFINTYSLFNMRFINEKNKRRLPDPKFTEPEAQGDLVHQIVKLQEALKECSHRHDDIRLMDTIVHLNKKLDKFIPLYSKYSAMMGIGPVDKPSSHDNSSELGSR